MDQIERDNEQELPFLAHGAQRVAAGSACALLALVSSSAGDPAVLRNAVVALLGAAQIGVGLRDLRARLPLHIPPGPLEGLGLTARSYLDEGTFPETGGHSARSSWLGRLRASSRELGEAARPFGFVVLLFAACTIVLAVAAVLFEPARLAAGFGACGTFVAFVAWSCLPDRTSIPRRFERERVLNAVHPPRELVSEVAAVLALEGPDGGAATVWRTELRGPAPDATGSIRGSEFRTTLLAETQPTPRPLDDRTPWNPRTLTSVGGSVLFVVGVWHLLAASGIAAAASALFGVWVGHALLFLARCGACGLTFRSDLYCVKISGRMDERSQAVGGGVYVLEEVWCRSTLRLQVYADRVVTETSPRFQLASLYPWRMRHEPLARAWRAPRTLVDSVSHVDGEPPLDDLVAALDGALADDRADDVHRLGRESSVSA